MRKLSLTALAFLLTSHAHAASSESWNLRTNPIAWVIGPNLRLDYKIADPWTLGLGVSGIDHKIKGVKLNAFSVGVFADYYFREAFVSSWFLDFAARFGTIKAETTDRVGALDHAEASNLSAQALLGYHWFWAHFNLDIGAGVESNSAGNSGIYDDNGNRVDSIPIPPLGLITDASIGVTF